MSEVYNVNEHNHVEWDENRLQERLATLHVNNRNIKYTGERLIQVQREIGLISFELSERFRETRQQEIHEAWLDREAEVC